MKILHVNHSDIIGGAGRAAYRIHKALLRHGVDSQMWVSKAITGDWSVHAQGSSWSNKFGDLRFSFSRAVSGLTRWETPGFCSPAVLPSRWPKQLNHSEADVINLHWVAGEMMSIADIGKLRGALVWTLHDMWAFCGAEHFTEEFRWRDGYMRSNRPSSETGIDLNRWTWRRKRRHWRKPIHVVAPSPWLADRARKSVIMSDWPVTSIPLAIDTEEWRPIDRLLARKILRLPMEPALLLFGAIGGTRDPRKGFDLLKGAFAHLRGEMSDLEVVVFGELPPKHPPDLGFPLHFAGHLQDDVSMCLYYSAADAVVVPSRMENLSNVCLEAFACGRPTVAFNATGLGSVIDHKETGYLARPFDTEDLARGIQWVLDGDERRAALSERCRQAAVEKFSAPVVAEQYIRLYEEACKS